VLSRCEGDVGAAEEEGLGYVARNIRAGELGGLSEGKRIVGVMSFGSYLSRFVQCVFLVSILFFRSPKTH